MPDKVEHSSLEPDSEAYQDGKKKAHEVAAKGHIREDAKPGFIGRMKEAFLGDDPKETALYFATQVVVPRIGDMVLDILDAGFDMARDSARLAITGEVADKRDRRYGNASYRNNRTNYTSYSDRRSRRLGARDRMQSNVHEYRFVGFDSREEAESVWYEMDEMLDTRPYVTVNDFFKIARMPSHCTPVGAEMGWRELGTLDVVPYNDEWRLNMPRARYIELR